MNTEINKMLESIMNKAQGRSMARLYMGNACKTCGQTLKPNDVGVDPYNNERLWMAECCGIKLDWTQPNA